MTDKPTTLITGAAGKLCKKLVPDMLADGYPIRALDQRRMDYDTDCVYGSIADFPTLRTNTQWMRLMIHTANVHNQLPFPASRTDGYDPYFDINVVGMRNVLRAALEAGVKKLIYISSVAYYGDLNGVIYEDSPPAVPTEYYGLTKQLCETQCRFYAKNHDLKIVILRPGFFNDTPEINWAFMQQRLHRDDVVQAVRKAIDYEPEDNIEAFSLTSAPPFQPQDMEGLRSDPLEVLNTYYPGSADLMRKNGVEPKPVERLFVTDAAREKLAYEPEYTIGAWLERLGWK